jgi:hypothetical protein
MMASAGETLPSTSAQALAKPYERLTAESEELLAQAAGFARGGDYLGAQARARFAKHCLVAIAASLPADDAWVRATHVHVDLRILHYDSLVRSWQLEVEARNATYVARERRAITVVD